ncbi:histone acetyltransferase 1 [Coemansia sp. RSA 1722]|nr:histone acetyltransferase 1 [Coemansia sp. RSA 486]KAJ2604851.1 histone acetyltransferase 1 [Coemansia sp. RSA 1722]
MDSTLAATASQWVTETNSALNIHLGNADTAEAVLQALEKDAAADANQDSADEEEEEESGADIIQFHPAFTYPIYGEHERVFGYKGLAINLHYAAGSLATYVDVRYKKNISAMESSLPIQLRADDVETPLLQVLSDSAMCRTKEEFASRVVKDTERFEPPGRKIHEYTRESIQYEVYLGDFSSEVVRRYHERMQTFALFFIEGAQFIDATDERWKIYMVFEKLVLEGHATACYSLVGFTTVYGFYHWPDMKRMRISQFLILPPYQNMGHGSALYRVVYGELVRDSKIVDLTVEDPSAVFDDMRDLCDLRYLLAQNAFDGITAPVSLAEIKKLGIRYKLARRQITRCLEIALLRQLAVKKDPNAYSEYRLFVKRRIYAQNSDLMSSMDADEKKQRVRDTYKGVEEDYHRIIALI